MKKYVFRDVILTIILQENIISHGGLIYRENRVRKKILKFDRKTLNMKTVVRQRIIF